MDKINPLYAIQLFSDLHIEFEELNISCENTDVVVFAGDKTAKHPMHW